MRRISDNELKLGFDMTKNATAKRSEREGAAGQFVIKKNSGSFSTELVTKRGNISAVQAEKAVRDYLRENEKKK